MEKTFAVLGIIGALLCAVGDLFLDIKGKDNKKLGKYGFIDSAWNHMNPGRFKVSILFAMCGVPLSFLGFLSMAHQLSLQSEGFGFAFFVSVMIGFTGGFFIHTIICLFPILFKQVEKKHGFDEGERLVNAVYDTIKIPFWVQYLFLVILPAFMVIYALFAGLLALSRWWVLATLPSLMLVSALLRKLNPDLFCDLPMVIAPSLSMAAVSLMALLNQMP